MGTLILASLFAVHVGPVRPEARALRDGGASQLFVIKANNYYPDASDDRERAYKNLDKLFFQRLSAATRKKKLNVTLKAMGATSLETHSGAKWRDGLDSTNQNHLNNAQYWKAVRETIESQEFRRAGDKARLVVLSGTAGFIKADDANYKVVKAFAEKNPGKIVSVVISEPRLFIKTNYVNPLSLAPGKSRDANEKAAQSAVDDALKNFGAQ